MNIFRLELLERDENQKGSENHVICGGGWERERGAIMFGVHHVLYGREMPQKCGK
jgi:hypothetical protein